MQVKLAEYHNVPIIPIPNISRFNTSFKFPSYEIKVEEPIETDNPKIKNIPTTLKFPTIKRQKRFISSNDSFSSVLDKLAAEDESIAKNKDILSRLAQVESNQRWDARNDRAYGAFQLMDFNITGDINDFINNPEEQIRQANRLLEFNKSQFTKKDLELAQKQGYSYDQLLAGAWLGGVGSVRKVLTGTGNPSDKDGVDVRSRMQKFQQGGVINKWLDDWNKARYNTGRFNDQLGNNQINIQKYNRDTTPVFNSSDERDKALDITNPIAQRYYNSNIGIVSTNPIRFKGGFYDQKDNFIQIVSPKQREYLENKFTSRLSNQQNQYEYMSPEWQQIEAQKKEIGTIFKNNSYDSQLLHEQSHASKAIPQESKISTIIPVEDEYLDNPSEIYSRLNQLRQYYKLDPNKIYQKSDIKNLKGPGFDILNRYDDKTVLRLLNEVADNNTKPELVNYAQEGVKLSKEKLELIDKLRKQGQTYIKADNSTKELKEANNRARRNKQLGENIKSIALNTAEGIASAVYPAVGAGLAIKNSYNNPIGGIIDAVSTAIPYLKFPRFKNGKINPNYKLNNNTKIEGDITQAELQDFYNVLNNKEIINKLSNIDQELNTNYTNTLINYLNSQDINPNIPVYKLNKDLKLNRQLGISRPTNDAVLIPESNNSYEFNVSNNRDLTTVGHELKHLYEYQSQFSDLVHNPSHKFIKQGLENPRLDKLIENNINNKIDLEKLIKIDNNQQLQDIINNYDYYSNPYEINAYLFNLSKYRIDNNLSPNFNYKSLNELEQDILNSSKYLSDDSLEKIYKYIIKDKDKFLKALNKYGYLLIPSIINSNNE